MKAKFYKHKLIFKQPSGTSRGVLLHKMSWYIVIYDNKWGRSGVGECSIIPGLSVDDSVDYEEVLKKVCSHIDDYDYWLAEGLLQWPSIRFGLEMALHDLWAEESMILFPSAFTSGIKAIEINGLVWMGSKTFMEHQIEEKIQQGFRCIKLKIGTLNFMDEMMLLQSIRGRYSADEIVLRVDANGAYTFDEAVKVLELLSELDIHSIEQPVKAGHWGEMARLCKNTPVPIALDEELIGITLLQDKRKMLESIAPQYIILKPSLLGGFAATQEWIDLAVEMGIGWWVTSALEGNIGLSAIAQWTCCLGNPLPQGLGTGGLFVNNITSPLYIEQGALHYGNAEAWKISYHDFE